MWENGSAESSTFKWSYDVCLSFRGEDTRDNFTSHLDMALRQKGVNVFIDDQLEREIQGSGSFADFLQGGSFGCTKTNWLVWRSIGQT
uniref:TIR domain-containing protein n=1 Tax=Cucumis sativus TaxID=3659 RepID=A0A0A0LFS0_CUCSA